jgi:hypothetical protein
MLTYLKDYKNLMNLRKNSSCAKNKIPHLSVKVGGKESIQVFNTVKNSQKNRKGSFVKESNILQTSNYDFSTLETETRETMFTEDLYLTKTYKKDDPDIKKFRFSINEIKAQTGENEEFYDNFHKKLLNDNKKFFSSKKIKSANKLIEINNLNDIGRLKSKTKEKKVTKEKIKKKEFLKIDSISFMSEKDEEETVAEKIGAEKKKTNGNILIIEDTKTNNKTHNSEAILSIEKSQVLTLNDLRNNKKIQNEQEEVKLPINMLQIVQEEPKIPIITKISPAKNKFHSKTKTEKQFVRKMSFLGAGTKTYNFELANKGVEMKKKKSKKNLIQVGEQNEPPKIPIMKIVENKPVLGLNNLSQIKLYHKKLNDNNLISPESHKVVSSATLPLLVNNTNMEKQKKKRSFFQMCFCG